MERRNLRCWTRVGVMNSGAPASWPARVAIVGDACKDAGDPRRPVDAVRERALVSRPVLRYKHAMIIAPLRLLPRLWRVRTRVSTAARSLAFSLLFPLV